MSDMEVNLKAFPQQSNQKRGVGYPIVHILGLISLAAGIMLGSRLRHYQAKGKGEASLFAQLFESLNAGDVIDRSFKSSLTELKLVEHMKIWFELVIN